MKERSRTNQELLEENASLKHKIQELELSESERRRAEEALHKSEAKFREIFETIEDLYYETDSEGLVKVLSPSVRRLTGWNEEDLIGKPATTVYVDTNNRDRLLLKLSERGYVHDYELLLKKKDGEDGTHLFLQGSLLMIMGDRLESRDYYVTSPNVSVWRNNLSSAETACPGLRLSPAAATGSSILSRKGCLCRRELEPYMESSTGSVRFRRYKRYLSPSTGTCSMRPSGDW